MPKLKGDLGPLERAVMEVVWERGDGGTTVRDVLASEHVQGYAYTTIMTILDRLWRKGFVSRSRIGRAYLYRAARTPEGYVEELVSQVLEGAGDRRSVMLGFVRGVDPDDLAELRKAIRQVERERKTTA